jgi:hypothetical protein
MTNTTKLGGDLVAAHAAIAVHGQDESAIAGQVENIGDSIVNEATEANRLLKNG